MRTPAVVIELEEHDQPVEVTVFPFVVPATEASLVDGGTALGTGPDEIDGGSVVP